MRDLPLPPDSHRVELVNKVAYPQKMILRGRLRFSGSNGYASKRWPDHQKDQSCPFMVTSPPVPQPTL